MLLRPGSFAAMLLATAYGAAATGEHPGALSTNEAYVEGLGQESTVDIHDSLAVFSFVIGSLSPEVNVYPTENYYYFSFLQRGMEYRGNIRLDVADRDDGILHFAYYLPTQGWRDELLRYERLGEDDGVSVRRLERLAYEVGFRGKRVTFRLNDLSSMQPPPDAILPGEKYLGPIFDDSGTQLYFLYNPDARRFLYVLNEAASTNAVLKVADWQPAVSVDQRTGFVFYADPFAARRILVGVSQQNVDVNNFFDGPFDQLPDNFMQEGAFLSAIVDAYPSLAGKVDEFGRIGGGGLTGRVLITPYRSYRAVGELEILSECDGAVAELERFYSCILPDE